jgi:hypothetical protein
LLFKGEDEALALAIQASLQDYSITTANVQQPTAQSETADEDAELAQAIAASLADQKAQQQMQRKKVITGWVAFSSVASLLSSCKSLAI